MNIETGRSREVTRAGANEMLITSLTKWRVTQGPWDCSGVRGDPALSGPGWGRGEVELHPGGKQLPH